MAGVSSVLSQPEIETRGLFFEAGLDLEVDFDFQADVGVELDGLVLPGEVKLDLGLDFTCRFP